MAKDATVSCTSDQFLWVEKYRPKKIKECILPKSMKKFFLSQVKEGQVQNMLFAGTHGTGKTTVARALAEEIGADVLFINCSRDTGIDVVRNKISQAATSVSLQGKPRIILCDEFDGYGAAGQAAARGVIEEVSANCRFIMTCNYPAKIIPPLLSRLCLVDFNTLTNDKENQTQLIKDFFYRCVEILKMEGVKIDPGTLGTFIKRHFPDYRKIISELQRAAASSDGAITDAILVKKTGSVDTFVEAIIENDFGAVREFLASTVLSPADLITALYNEVLTREEFKKGLPQIILHLNEAQYKSQFVANPQINLAALSIEIMSCI